MSGWWLPASFHNKSNILTHMGVSNFLFRWAVLQCPYWWLAVRNLAIRQFIVFMECLRTSCIYLIACYCTHLEGLHTNFGPIHCRGYDQWLAENWEYLQELKSLALQQGVGDQVVFVPLCSTLQRNTLLAACLCVIYTPMVRQFHCTSTISKEFSKLTCYHLFG
jgi:hypothetical protein